MSECVQALHTLSAPVVYFTNTSSVCSSMMTLGQHWEEPVRKEPATRALHSEVDGWYLELVEQVMHQLAELDD